MDYHQLKDQLNEIINVAESVPDRYHDTCFEILLDRFLEQEHTIKEGKDRQAVKAKSGAAPAFSVPAKVKTFLRRYRLTDEQLQEVVLLEDDELHFVRQPGDVPVAKGQIQWALLLALESALKGGEFSADPEGVRSICIEQGFYDSPNFASTFKSPANSKLFSDTMVPHGDRRKLTREGETELAALIRTLSSEATQ